MDGKTLKVCLLGASFDVGNGVRALTLGTIQCILHSNPEAQISLLDYAKEGREVNLPWGGRMVAVRVINLRFSKKFYLANNVARLIATSLLLRLVPSGIRTKIIHRNTWLQHIHDVDLIASIAGGDSFSDIYGIGRFLYVSLPQLLAISMGKRLILLPQTLGPFRSGLARVIAKYILSRADTIYSRDHDGLKSAAELLGVKSVAGKLKFCYDLAFVLEPAAPTCADPFELPAKKADGPCLVGLNVSGLLSMGGYNRQNMFGLRVDYNELNRGITRLLLEQKNAIVLLVPHVVGTGLECDSPACEALYAELKDRYGDRVKMVSGDYNQSEIKYIIGQCDFFIGSRMHACIAAVSQCVPAVSIAYSDKFAGVMQTLGAELLVADARKRDQTEILRTVDQAFEGRREMRRQLELKIPHVRARVLGIFKEAGYQHRDSCSIETNNAKHSQKTVDRIHSPT
jgi:polysaccharide pyruvyl transferase WcaK-like protein